MNHSDSTICPECGKPVPTDGQHKICPACLMAQALASRTILSGGEAGGTCQTPPVAEIADKFPGFETDVPE